MPAPSIMRIGPPILWWSSPRGGYPPQAPAAAGRIRPVLSAARPVVWWVQQLGASLAPPAASPGQPRAWLSELCPAVAWSLFRPRGGSGSPTYAVGDARPNPLAASSAAADVDPLAAVSAAVSARPDPTAASSRRPGTIA